MREFFVMVLECDDVFMEGYLGGKRVGDRRMRGFIIIWIGF